jgi:RNA polymerase sigma-70 factor (ECF subfamily)
VTRVAKKLEPCVPEPEALARLAQGGDVSAFEALVGLYGPRLLRYIRQRVGNLHTAEDLLQDTFLKAFGALSRYDCSRSLTTWLFTIATRVAISHGRRRFEVSVAAPHELGTAQAAAPDAAMIRAEAHCGLWDCARAALPDSQFASLWLKYAEEMPVSQIADIVGVSVSNVKVMLHRARKKLAECIDIEDRPARGQNKDEGSGPRAGSAEVNHVGKSMQPGQV